MAIIVIIRNRIQIYHDIFGIESKYIKYFVCFGFQVSEFNETK